MHTPCNYPYEVHKSFTDPGEYETCNLAPQQRLPKCEKPDMIQTASAQHGHDSIPVHTYLTVRLGESRMAYRPHGKK
jgi:hypothetical protein